MLSLSPVFAKFCVLCTLSVIFLASLLALVDQQKVLQHHQHYKSTDARKIRSKTRKLFDYMRENGVNEPTYVAARAERYVLKHGPLELGYNNTENVAEGCKIWNSPLEAPEIYPALQSYREDLKAYTDAINHFSYIRERGIADIRKLLKGDQEADYNTCQMLEVSKQSSVNSGNVPLNLRNSFFSASGQLSRTIQGGWMEPLLPPMRHPDFCIVKKGHYLNLDFLVHDFAHICRRLKPTSRVVLFDLGGSSKFAGVSKASRKLLQRFYQFGIPFDHIHAFEIKPTSDKLKYELAPRQMKAAQQLHVTYHWVTGDVSAEPGHPQNPFTILEKEYNEDDLVLVKMDIDVPEIEMKFAKQLLDSSKLWNLVDQFYFEHHVRMLEMDRAWKNYMTGTVQDTLELFTALRERGIPAHFWV